MDSALLIVLAVVLIGSACLGPPCWVGYKAKKRGYDFREYFEIAFFHQWWVALEELDHREEVDKLQGQIHDLSLKLDINRPESKKECPFCSREIPQESVFCHLCGGNVQEKEQEIKAQKQNELEEKGFIALFDDDAFMKKANEVRRIYGKGAYVSHLKDKAKELGLGDLSDEDVAQFINQ